MFPVGQEKHENGSCSQAGDGCSTYVLHRHEGGLLHDFAFQYGGRKMSGITAQGIHILRETSDMVLLPMVERIGINGGSDHGGYGIAHTYHQKDEGGKIARRQSLHPPCRNEGIKHEQAREIEQHGQPQVVEHAFGLILEIEVGIRRCHQQECQGEDPSEMHLPHNQKQGQH